MKPEDIKSLQDLLISAHAAVCLAAEYLRDAVEALGEAVRDEHLSDMVVSHHPITIINGGGADSACDGVSLIIKAMTATPPANKP